MNLIISRVSQEHWISQRLEPIDQPIPIVSRFHSGIFQPLFIRCQDLHNRLEFTIQFVMGQARAFLVNQANYRVVAM